MTSDQGIAGSSPVRVIIFIQRFKERTIIKNIKPHNNNITINVSDKLFPLISKIALKLGDSLSKLER